MDISVRFQHEVLVTVVAQGDLKKNIWSVSVAEASACRDALHLAEYTRAIRYQVVIGGEMLPDKWKEEHDCRLQELARLPGQDARVPEDRRTALTVGSLRQRCSVEWEEQRLNDANGS